MFNVLVSTHPFGDSGREPMEILENAGCRVTLNPHKRRMTPEELAALLSESGAEGLVAGTEPVTRAVIERTPKLRVIARVGVGYDNIDMDAAREAGVVVTYTPQAPALAVAELTIGFVVDLLRRISRADRLIREGSWGKYLGHRVRERIIGVAGVGRIGKRVVHLLHPFGCRIIAHDVKPDRTFGDIYGLRWVDKQTLLKESDLVTVHLPLTARTYHWIDDNALCRMKPGALLINTARGPIVDEEALMRALDSDKLGGAAIDVFEKEPYAGPLCNYKQVVLTCHMGAGTQESRLELDAAAAADCVRVLKIEKPLSPVPEDVDTLPDCPPK